MILIDHIISKSVFQRVPTGLKNLHGKEYCEFLKMAFAEILDFWRGLKTRYEAPKRYK